MEGIELPDQKIIRTFKEKQNYLGILEAHTIKQAEMKEKKVKKRVPQTNGKAFRNQSSVAEISSKK